jgi:hypothetical protein
LRELEAPTLKEPLTLVVVTNEGSRHRPAPICRVEWRGTRITPGVGKGRETKELYEQAMARLGFTDPHKGTDEA